MRSLLTGSFFTDIYGPKLCVQFLHSELQSSGMLRSVLLVSYRRFGTTYQSHLQGSSRTIAVRITILRCIKSQKMGDLAS